MPTAVFIRTPEYRLKQHLTPHKRGWRRSEEAGLKQSQTRKRLFAEGKLTVWNKGKTKEDCPQLGNSGVKKGYKYLPNRKGWNEGLTKETDERVKNISEANKGHIPWNKNMVGCKHSGSFKNGHKAWNKDKKGLQVSWSKGLTAVTDERIKRGVEKRIGRIKTKEEIKKMLRRRIPTSLEKKFQSIINKHNLPYKYVGDGSFIIGHYNPDFINTNSEKIAVEVYARFYKQLDNRNIEDWKKQRSKVFAKYGWSIIYFNEKQVNENNVLEILKKR